jgi:hypothetical protein
MNLSMLRTKTSTAGGNSSMISSYTFTEVVKGNRREIAAEAIKHSKKGLKDYFQNGIRSIHNASGLSKEVATYSSTTFLNQ